MAIRALGDIAESVEGLVIFLLIHDDSLLDNSSAASTFSAMQERCSGS